MMATNIKGQLKQKRQRSYLNRDFDSLRANLLQYARTYYPDRISDFSDASVGGMFLDFAAYVGDVMSFYLDHQFNELDPTTAVERSNVIRMIKGAGVKITGATPSTVACDIYFEVTSTLSNGVYIPNPYQLPKVLSGTTATSNSGVLFELLDDVDFSETDSDGLLVANYKISAVDAAGNPSAFIVRRSGSFTSSKTLSESLTVPDTFVPFRTISLQTPDVSEIISVRDSDGNLYYEVDFLTQDVVFKRVTNTQVDADRVPESLELSPAPYRFISQTDLDTGITTLQFGSGDADTLDNDIIPDPSEIAVPLYGPRKTFSRFTLDPGTLLGTKTLGISPRNTTLTVTYRAGGGISHNVDSGTIRSFKDLRTQFSDILLPPTIAAVRASSDINNPSPAAGGETKPTLEELRALIPSYRNSQLRIVTKEDLIARVYTMPSNFGRVFRVGVRSNENNPLASTISIVSRDASGQLVQSPDALKKNLATFINQYRLISDGLDIVDASIVNFIVKFSVSVDITSNKSVVVQNVTNKIREYFQITNFQIDQPIVTSEVISTILATDGVISLVNLQFLNRSGVYEGRLYSNVQFDFASNTSKGVIFGMPGSIFELKYPRSDIFGVAV
jgi:hypothetical protein